MNTATKRRVTLKEVENENSDRLWIYNRGTIGGHTGTVNITHTTKRNYTVPIAIPSTWIPIDMTTYAPKEELLDNHDFLSLIRKGILEYCLNSEAEKIMEDSEAQSELEEINRFRDRVQENVEESLVDDTMPEGMKLQKPQAGEIEAIRNVNPALIDLFNRPTEEVSDSQRYSTVRTLISSGKGLQVNDLEYVLARATTNSSLAKLVAEKLNEIRNSK